MRSPKYHDYRVAKIALFIILVILGLFIYIKCIRAPLEHTAGENAWTVIEAATCTEDGLRCKICTECGEEFDHEVIPATGHVEGSWVIEKNATCTESGARYKPCMNCDYEFDREVIPATEHTPGAAKVENMSQSTCTENGSYDNAVYCKTCKAELSRETVELELEPHNYGEEYRENIDQPMPHTIYGTYDAVKICKDCGYESRITKVLEPEGHSYEWELKYDSETGEFTMIGTCDCDEDGNVVVLPVDNQYVELDKTVPSCCRKICTVTIEYQGETITKTIELEPDAHRIHRVELIDPETTEEITLYVSVSDFEKWDDNYGAYYEYGLEGLIYLNIEGGNEWDENGFALGAYKCVLCEDAQCSECNGDYWYIVRIYSPEHDKRLTQDPEN